MSLRRAAAIAVGLALAALAAGPAGSQAPGPAPAAAPPAPAAGEAPTAPAAAVPAPAAIALPEISGRAELAGRRLREIEADVAASETALAPIAKLDAEARQRLPQHAEEVSDALAGRLSLEQIDDLARRGKAFAVQVEQWHVAATRQAEALEQRLVELDAMRETWELTLARAQAEGAPEPLLDAVKQVRSAIRSTQKQVSERRAATLTLQSEIARTGAMLSLLTDDMGRASLAQRGRLLERDRPALWSALGASPSARSMWKRVGRTLESSGETIVLFGRLQRDRIAAHGALFAGLLAVAVWLRRRRRQRLAEGKAVGPSDVVLDQPVAIALLGALLATPFLYLNVPMAVRRMVGVLTLAPLLLLLPRVVARELRRVWIALAAWYLIDALRYVVQAAELIERLLLLLETAAAALIALWLLRGRRLEALAPPGRWLRALDGALRVAFAALVVATIANVLGFLSLARELGEGVILSAYLAAVVYGAVKVAEPVSEALVRSAPARALRSLTRHREAVLRGTRRALVWLGLGAWLAITLREFMLLDPLLAGLRAAVGHRIGIGAVSISLGDVLACLTTLAAAFGLSRLARMLLAEEVFPRTRLARGVPNAISATVGYGILFLGFLLAAGAAGIDFNRVTLLAGAFGVGIGFGLQNVVNNFVSGLILLYERPIQVGDTVEVGGLLGEVRRIGIRSSTVRTLQGAEVILPNATLIAEPVTNWTLSDRSRRVELPVGVAYGTDPQRVIELLVGVAKADPEVLREPPPAALFQAFGESSLDFELRVWTPNFEDSMALRSRLAMGVHRALREAGIEIPFPQRDMHVTLEGAAAERLGRARRS